MVVTAGVITAQAIPIDIMEEPLHCCSSPTTTPDFSKSYLCGNPRAKTPTRAKTPAVRPRGYRRRFLPIQGTRPGGVRLP